MTHTLGLEATKLEKPSIVTIGVFDGIHIGHQRLIRALVDAARTTDRLAVVLTFFPHPDAVLHGIKGRYYLMSPEERADMLLAMGVDVVVTQPFNNALRQMRAQAFVESLRTHLQLSALWVGPDFALGYRREGDLAFLRAQGAAHGFDVSTVDVVTEAGDGTIISSTQLRRLLEAGDVETAAEWLARPYSLRGSVVQGDQRGRLLGFPTANLAVWDEQVIPALGVYAGWAEVRGLRYAAVTNIGVRPTFDGQRMRVEPHLLDFSGDIYGENLTISFTARLRSEQKFDGVDALMAQLHRDVEQARSILLRP
jgi:riboflavin kinase/FMN adenylyltransferase